MGDVTIHKLYILRGAKVVDARSTTDTLKTLKTRVPTWELQLGN